MKKWLIFLAWAAGLALLAQPAPAAEPQRSRPPDSGSTVDRLDADSDGQIRKEQVIARVKQVFDKLDRNQDGRIDRDEARRALQAVAGHLSDPGPRSPESARRSAPDRGPAPTIHRDQRPKRPFEPDRGRGPARPGWDGRSAGGWGPWAPWMHRGPQRGFDPWRGRGPERPGWDGRSAGGWGLWAPWGYRGPQHGFEPWRGRGPARPGFDGRSAGGSDPGRGDRGRARLEMDSRSTERGGPGPWWIGPDWKPRPSGPPKEIDGKGPDESRRVQGPRPRPDQDARDRPERNGVSQRDAEEGRRPVARNSNEKE